jgi:type IV pilus assembly protein PilW
MNSRMRRQARGFTLVELLVAVTVGMALVLAVTTMLIRNESGRRSMTSMNDVSVGGAYVSFVLDRTVRSAGSGFIQAWKAGYGCQLLVSRSSTQILPRASNFPAPFASLPHTQRLAPLIVYAGQGAGSSDVLAVATGSSGLGESPLRVLPSSATSSQLRVPATVGLRAGDLVLVMQDGSNCMVEQLATGFAGGADQLLSFGGTYAAGTINSVALSGLGTTSTAWVAPIGNVAGNQPTFQFIGVGANNTLQSYDLLRLDGTDASVPLSDGVVDMRALYGLDTNGDGTVDTWVGPGTSPYDYASLTDGTATAQANLVKILAVRIGLVLCNSQPEKTAVSPDSLTLFADLTSDLRRTRTLSTSDQLMRWRTVEFTVPLRNPMLK